LHPPRANGPARETSQGGAILFFFNIVTRIGTLAENPIFLVSGKIALTGIERV
jgi:hypothetical protein